jgi:hypothetical protein
VAESSSRAEAFNRWWTLGSTIIAPATLLSTLLFYFGYVSSRAQYRYFGLDVDTVGLSTQDYVMRSPQALLVPLLTLSLGGAALLLAHLAVRRHPPPRWAVRVLLGTAVLVLVTGAVLVVTYAQVGDWPAYPLVTPLLLAAGSAGVLYAIRLPGAPVFVAATDADGRALRRGVLAFALVAIVACLFWATATLAEWTGLGNGMRTARELDRLPPVVLDTRERLFLPAGSVEETALPQEDESRFRYRYRGLRLLIQGDGRLFLVPDTWSASASTIVVPLDDSVRVRFQFVNRAP